LAVIRRRSILSRLGYGRVEWSYLLQNLRCFECLGQSLLAERALHFNRAEWFHEEENQFAPSGIYII
jgi:hypothetical protein